MANFQPNTVGGLNPLTQSVYALSSAMFDPQTEYKRRIADSQAAVDQAQIANYGANAKKLGSETSLNTQKFDARAAIGEIIKHAQRPDGTIDPNQMGAISGALFQGSGDGSDLGNLGDILAQGELNAPGNERHALIRMGKMPDQNFAATMGESNAISGRDAAEDLREATTVQGMENYQSGINNALDNDTSRLNNAADNTQSGANNAADNVQSGLNNAADNVQSGLNNGADIAARTLDGNKPLWTAFEDGNGNTFLLNTHSAEQPALMPAEGAPAGGLNKIGTPKAPPPSKPAVITPKLLEDLDDRVSNQFGGYDIGDSDLPADVEDRAATLFQTGDPASGLQPGNMVGAVNQAFGEMVDASGGDHGWFDSPDAMRKQAAPAQQQQFQEGATLKQNGITYKVINGVPVAQ